MPSVDEKPWLAPNLWVIVAVKYAVLVKGCFSRQVFRHVNMLLKQSVIRLPYEKNNYIISKNFPLSRTIIPVFK